MIYGVALSGATHVTFCFTTRRWNAIMGYLFTFSMFRGLDDAIQTISSSNLTYVHELLNELKQQEDTDYDNFRKSDVPVELMQKIFDERDDLNMVNLTTLAKSPSICHTALLPSESRYRGIATETQNTFYSGIELHQALSDAASRGGSFAEMRLVYTEHLRFRQPNSGFKTLAEDYEHCPVPTTIDYRDYFFLHHDENWKNLIVPNDVELKVYGKPGHEFLGYVAICLVVTCHNGCPAEALTRDEVFGPNSTEFIKLNINGQEVVRGLSMGRECDLLQHHHGLVFPTRKISESDSIGKFEIAAKVMVPNRYLRISSVIVW